MNAEKNAIPRVPLLWLAAALLFTVPPMFGNIAAWVPLCFVASLVAKFWMEKRGWRLRSAAWKIAGAAVVLGGVEATYHSLIGLEPGLSIYMLLISVKILEAYTTRDFHTLALLGWFLSLAGLFVSQSLGAGLYAGVAFCLIITAVLRFHLGGAPGERNVRRPLKLAAGLVLQAAPLVIVMFFLFPRGSGAFRFEFHRSFFNRSGMSDHLQPGSVASMALSNDVAFRAEFPDGNVPRPAAMYWRGAVLTKDEGLTWYPGVGTGDVMTRGSGNPIRQRIIIQPNGGQWLFALDWPVGNSHDSLLLSGNVLRANKSIYSPRRYEVISYPTNWKRTLSDRERAVCLQLPDKIPARANQLVQSWMAEGGDPHAMVTRALQFFRKENFRYSLSPGEYNANGFDEFLFRRKIGFCEHYAAAFGTLMRLAGIPSRVVVGYQGGQFNGLGGYLVVRQSDAHAWCEVWLPDVGWQRVDPTAAVAPGRVDLGFSSYMDMSSASSAGAAGIGDLRVSGAWGSQTLIRKMQMAWDTISYEWDVHVLNFDEESQQTFFFGLGFFDLRPLHMLGWLALVIGGLVCAQSLWSWWRNRIVPDALKSLYARFCRRVGKLGVTREPWEGPGRFSERAAQLLPAHAEPIRRIAALYASLRYSALPATTARTRELREEISGFCKSR